MVSSDSWSREKYMSASKASENSFSHAVQFQGSWITGETWKLKLPLKSEFISHLVNSPSRSALPFSHTLLLKPVLLPSKSLGVAMVFSHL